MNLYATDATRFAAATAPRAAIAVSLCLLLAACDEPMAAAQETTVEHAPAAQGPGPGHEHGHPDGDKHAVASRTVRVVPVRRLAGPVVSWPAVTVATSAHEAAVATTVAGRVAEVPVSVGDHVSKGAVVVTLQSPERQRLAVEEKLAHDQLDVVLRRLGKVRRQQRRGLMLADAAYELERDAARLRAAEQRAATALAAMRDPNCAPSSVHRGGADRIALCAPISGVVEAVNARVGGRVIAGSEACVTLRAVASGRVRIDRWGPPPPGLRLRFEAHGVDVPLAAEPLASVVEPHTGVVHAYHLPDPATALAAGLRGEVVGMLGGAAEPSFAVPRAAVAQRDGALVVFRLTTAGTAKPVATPVVVLGGDDTEVWVRSRADAPSPLTKDDQVLAVAPALEGGVGGH